jgi:lipoate-protein ligase A
MKYLDLTLPTPEENLACDEALLDACDESGSPADEVLRFWEPTRPFVALGYANREATEANADFCSRHGIPILRRCTGGGTVLQAPGVLNYSVILVITPDSPVQSISSTNDYVLAQLVKALAPALNAPVESRGQTDLAIGGLKICGNAQRRKKSALLFHGSFLLNLDFQLLEQALPMPSKQPDYRANRSHTDFLKNLQSDPARIKRALREVWEAREVLPDAPQSRIRRLVEEKYLTPEWNHKF